VKPAPAPRVCDWMSARLITVQADDPPIRALELMAEHRIRHLLVLDSLGKLAGIVSNRDFAKLVLSARGDVHQELHLGRVGTMMTRAPLVAATVDTTLRDAANRMRVSRISALPVLEGTAVIGIITTDDVLAAVATGEVALGRARAS
jgi:CBS domain-containing protein